MQHFYAKYCNTKIGLPLVVIHAIVLNLKI